VVNAAKLIAFTRKVMGNLESEHLEKKAQLYLENPTIAGLFCLAKLLGIIRKLLAS